MSSGDCPEHEALTLMFKDLCNVLSINKLFPSLISNFVIDYNDQTEICDTEQTDPKRVGLLIDKIRKQLSINNTEPFYKFLDVLKKDNSSSFVASRLEHCLKFQQSRERSSPSHGEL